MSSGLAFPFAGRLYDSAGERRLAGDRLSSAPFLDPLRDRVLPAPAAMHSSAAPIAPDSSRSPSRAPMKMPATLGSKEAPSGLPMISCNLATSAAVSDSSCQFACRCAAPVSLATTRGSGPDHPLKIHTPALIDDCRWMMIKRQDDISRDRVLPAGRSRPRFPVRVEACQACLHPPATCLPAVTTASRHPKPCSLNVHSSRMMPYPSPEVSSPGWRRFRAARQASTMACPAA
jgi:hypothetical protein